ncbi:hypothetical protein [Streptomyces sp. NPDC058457]|uniref:hypothetical protein n=1 Tax=Streptomyces sp. NPDC058457 TaxID=3346507 RepID=UPI0036533B65
MSDVTFTEDEKHLLKVAAHGAVYLIAAAKPSPVSSAKAGMAADRTLATAGTGAAGRVLAEKANDVKVPGGSVAEGADRILPASPGPASLRLPHPTAGAGRCARGRR